MNERPIVVFGEDWGRHPSSTQHLIGRLGKSREILWINSMGLRRPRVNKSDLKRIVQKLIGSKSSKADQPVTHALPKPHIFEPRNIPLPGNPIARWYNRIILSAQIRKACKAHQIRRPILWISLPVAVDLVGHLDEFVVVYYCGDDFGGLAGVDHAPVLKLESELVAAADLVLAASENLARKFPIDKTRVLAHGVDFDLFSTAAKRASDLPEGKPIAGFYGSISDWVDVALLAALAKKRPDWNFCLVGDIRTDVSALAPCDNVHFLGPKPHHELPRYVQHWQVAMLPFHDNAQIRACNPLKLREYLASGTAVVSTDFPALAPYRDLLTICNDVEMFSQALDGSRGHNAAAKATQQERVSKESWDARCQDAIDWISQCQE